MVAFVPPSGNEKPLGPWTKSITFVTTINCKLSVAFPVSVFLFIAAEPDYTAEPRYNNEVIGVTNDFLYPKNSKTYEKETQCNHITKSRYSANILPVPWPFIISRFHGNRSFLFIHNISDMSLFPIPRISGNRQK